LDDPDERLLLVANNEPKLHRAGLGILDLWRGFPLQPDQAEHGRRRTI
jgi:hypothetical protein